MTIAVAVIGAGFMGQLWARALHEHIGATVTVIGDIDEGRGRALAEKVGARHIGNAADAATAPGVDAVVVCTPEHLHLEPTVAAIGAGRPTAIEKPTAHTVEVADEIARLVRTSGVPVLAGHVLRLEPRYAALKAAIAAGTIGKVISIRNERLGLQADRARLGARTTVALYYGVHEFDIARWFGGDIEVIHGEGTPDLLSGAIRFKSGASGTIQVGWCLPDRTPGYGMASVTVVGESGMLKVTQGDNGITIVGTDGLLDADVTYAPDVNGRLGGMIAREADHFVAVAMGREAPICTADDGAAAVRYALALETSARNRVSVTL